VFCVQANDTAVTKGAGAGAVESISGRFLRLIDDEHLDRAFTRIEFQANLLYRRHDGRGSVELIRVGGVVKSEVVVSSQAGPVQNRNFQ
jgi:hypothetical protein